MEIKPLIYRLYSTKLCILLRLCIITKLFIGLLQDGLIEIANLIETEVYPDPATLTPLHNLYPKLLILYNNSCYKVQYIFYDRDRIKFF